MFILSSVTRQNQRLATYVLLSILLGMFILSSVTRQNHWSSAYVLLSLLFKIFILFSATRQNQWSSAYVLQSLLFKIFILFSASRNNHWSSAHVLLSILLSHLLSPTSLSAGAFPHGGTGDWTGDLHLPWPGSSSPTTSGYVIATEELTSTIEWMGDIFPAKYFHCTL